MSVLDELRALEAQATPAPWTWDEDGDLMAEWELEPRDGTVVAGIGSSGDRPTDADAAFIAAARNVLLALLDIAEAASRLCADDHLIVDITELRNALARLRSGAKERAS